MGVKPTPTSYGRRRARFRNPQPARTRTSRMPDPTDTTGPVPPALQRSAAERLLGRGSDAEAAARFIRNAPSVGIDLGLLFGTIGVDPNGDRVARQVCLAVPGSGRTAMLFLAPPGEPDRCGPMAEQAGERVAAIGAAMDALRASPGPGASEPRFVVAQALPEPQEIWAIDSFDRAGFTRVGDLAYLRVPMGSLDHLGEPEPLPEGVTLEQVGDLNDPGRRAALIRALERSYQDTLDCPALCGMRPTEDVVDSHAATGVFDPQRWWVVKLDGEPEGCCLMSHCPAHRSVELVYIGISPAIRGRGVGGTVLRRALREVRRIKADEVTCAVDRSNAPALKLYESLGFEEFTGRVAFVKRVHA